MKRQIVPSDTAASAVKRAVADLEGCRPDQLGTLGGAVDTAELNALADGSSDNPVDEVHSLVFQYCGYSVAVYSDRFLHVET